MDPNKSKKINVVNEIWEYSQKKFNFEIVRNLNYEKTIKEIKLNGKNFYALKIKIIEKNQKEKIESTKKEQLISKRLKSNSIIKTLATFEVPGFNEYNNKNLYLFFLEKSTYRDLKKFLTVFYKGYILRNSIDIKYKIKWIFEFSEVIISFFIYQIVKSIYVLKINQFYHNNITLDNILLCKNYVIKLCGFSNLSCKENKNKKTNYFIEEIIYELNNKEYFENKYNYNIKKNNINLNEIIKNDKDNVLKNFVEEIKNDNFDFKKIFNSDLFKNNKELIKQIKNNNYNEEYKFFIELQKIKYLENQNKKEKKIKLK